MTVPEGGAELSSEWLAASVALVDARARALTLELADALGRMAAWTFWAVIPAIRFQNFVGDYFFLGADASSICSALP